MFHYSGTAKTRMNRIVKLLYSVQFSSVAQSCLTLCDPMNCSTPGFPVLHHHRELAQTHVHWVGDAIQAFHPLSSPSPPAFSLSNEHPGLNSFRMDWLDLLAVPGTLKSLLQHHSSKALILYLFLKWGKKSRFVWGFLTLGTNRVSIWSI